MGSSFSSRDKLNLFWFLIAIFTALFAGSLFGNFLVAALVFGVTIAVLVSTGNVRLDLNTYKGRPHHGRSRKPWQRSGYVQRN